MACAQSVAWFLLSTWLQEKQLSDWAFAVHRDHFVELIELNAEAEGPRARENNSYWKSKATRAQELIDKVSDSLYGSQPRESS